MTPSRYFNIHSTKHAGKVALVTGGSTGIGLATAKRLAREGATVFITGRRQDALDAALAEIGHDAQAIRGDNSSAADIEKIIARVSSAHKKIDILFANAGGREFAPLGDITEAQFDKYVGINMKGTLLTVQGTLPKAKEQSLFVHISLLVEPTTQKEIKSRLLAAGLKPFMMEHGFCHSLYIKDPNGLILEFTVNHEDSASIYAERASSAHHDLERWMSDDRNTNNRWRSF